MAKRPTPSTPTGDATPVVEKTLEQLSANVRAAMTAHRMALHSHIDALRAHMSVERGLLQDAKDALVREDFDYD